MPDALEPKTGPKTKAGITWINGHGKKVTANINLTLNIEDFRGTPGYALLALAANMDTSVPTVEKWLWLVGVEVSARYLYRRRWMLQKPKTVNKPGPKENQDGRYAQAIRIMAENRTRSVRQLVWLLKQYGITRSREWVRQHRCDGLSDNCSAI
jgi:hypothetical protein